MSDLDIRIPEASRAKAERIYAGLMAGFCVVLVLTNIIGTKLFLAFPEQLPNGFFGAGPITLTSGIITYPLTFLFTDIVSEIYGRRRADLMVWTGFALSLVMLVLVQISIALPGSDAWVSKSSGYESVEGMQQAWESVFTLPGILIFASMTAYLVAQLMDNRLFHFWRRVTKGKHLWLRNNGSTWISQFFDTVIVNSIFLGFGLHMNWDIIWQIIVANYIFKLVLAVLDTPLIYLGVGWLRRKLAIVERT